MVDAAPQFETADKLGTTDMFSGTVDATGVNVPSVAGDDIDEIGIRCAVDQDFRRRLEVSYDGGTNWIRLRVGEAREDEFRGSIKQIRLRSAGSQPDCDYEVVMNRGPG